MDIYESIFSVMTEMNANMVRQKAALYAIAEELNRIRHCLSDEVGVYDDVIEVSLRIPSQECAKIPDPCGSAGETAT